MRLVDFLPFLIAPVIGIRTAVPSSRPARSPLMV